MDPYEIFGRYPIRNPDGTIKETTSITIERLQWYIDRLKAHDYTDKEEAVVDTEILDMADGRRIVSFNMGSFFSRGIPGDNGGLKDCSKCKERK